MHRRRRQHHPLRSLWQHLPRHTNLSRRCLRGRHPLPTPPATMPRHLRRHHPRPHELRCVWQPMSPRPHVRRRRLPHATLVPSRSHGMFGHLRRHCQRPQSLWELWPCVQPGTVVPHGGLRNVLPLPGWTHVVWKTLRRHTNEPCPLWNVRSRLRCWTSMHGGYVPHDGLPHRTAPLRQHLRLHGHRSQQLRCLRSHLRAGADVHRWHLHRSDHLPHRSDTLWRVVLRLAQRPAPLWHVQPPLQRGPDLPGRYLRRRTKPVPHGPNRLRSHGAKPALCQPRDQQRALRRVQPTMPEWSHVRGRRLHLPHGLHPLWPQLRQPSERRRTLRRVRTALQRRTDLPDGNVPLRDGPHPLRGCLRRYPKR